VGPLLWPPLHRLLVRISSAYIGLREAHLAGSGKADDPPVDVGNRCR
jgi:hypothetical protein